MLKFFYLFLSIFAFANANDQIEIFATSMESNATIVEAHGEIVVSYKDFLLTANEAKYNRLSGELELFDNVRATREGQYKLLGSYAKLNILKKESTFKPFFMLDTDSVVWLSAGNGYAKDKDVDVKSGVMSGCNPNDPLWKIEFTSSDYNTKSKWLNLYNARIYIYDIPVLYTPYIGYSLDTKRRTGVLTPSIGLSDKEGFYYEQSIYIAEQNWWDLELRPQTRTERGYGGYSTFRFVDSKTSKGQLSTGYFKEKSTYFKEQQLVNDTHYGYNFNYNNTDFINQWFNSSISGQSGLYIDINNMNDVDYINLSTNDSTQNATATQVLSKINMFYNTDENYIASYFKYYKDLTKEDNEDTLQKLPTLHYHHYLNSYFKDHIFYNIDVQSDNITRDVDESVVKTNVNIPVTFQTSLFDEYLNISYKSLFFAQEVSFRGTPTDTNVKKSNDGYYLDNTNIVGMSTQLTKSYSDFIHTLDFGINYTFAGSELRDGFYKDNQYATTTQEFYNITETQEQYQISFEEYFYNIEGEQKIYHRLSQVIANENKSQDLRELENEFDYKITSNLSLYNNLFYNYDEKSISKSLNSISFNEFGLNLSVSHLFKHNFKNDANPLYESFMTSSASYTYDKHYSYKAKWDYDLQNNLKKSAEIGFLYKKRCWDFGLRYVENNSPVLTNGSYSSIFERYLYITVVLRPLMNSDSGTSNFAIRMPESLKGS